MRLPIFVLKISQFDRNGVNPFHNQEVLGFDVYENDWISVRYCEQSNRFFDLKDNSVFPFTRMHKWKPKI